jgi:hypothetical protein
MASYEDMAKLFESANPDNPGGSSKVEAQAAVIAKKNGFASLAEYEGAWMNILMIMSGIDPQTKKFTEPPNQIKNEIAALKADKSVPEAEKKQGLAQLEAALKNAKPIQFKENITLVLKYFDQLAPLMREQDSDLRPADWRHISSSATSKAKLDAAQTSNAPTPLLRQQARTSRAVASAFRRRSPACHSARARPASA